MFYFDRFCCIVINAKIMQKIIILAVVISVNASFSFSKNGAYAQCYLMLKPGKTNTHTHMLTRKKRFLMIKTKRK